ncbi:MAG TPA: 50S ribosomal protein L6 [Bacillota bacterium]|nr:50S ribosomal protein L6 [Clostridiales bacterium]HPT85825.1 50S ribosomal protein L6 [Bacillota bacterium]
MSRIGNKPITIPAGVDVTIGEGNFVTVKGPLGTLSQQLSPKMKIEKEGSTIRIVTPSLEKEYNSLHGLTRTLLNNMVVGVTEGYAKQLEIVGVGYRAVKNGKTLTLSLGYSHPIVFEEGNGITFEVPNPNTIIVKGIDKQIVGEIAAQIRRKRPPEPYLGKGVRYAGEHIRRKSGKAGK